MTPSVESVERYLGEQGHTAQTIKTYMYDICVFTGAHPEAKRYRYKDIIEYIYEQNKKYPESDTPNRILSSLKKYYDYLVKTDQREDHPCRTLYVKSKKAKDVMHWNLFAGEELEKLLNREERYQDLMLKNQAIISLLIYQGLSTGEIARLKQKHIDFDNGTVFIKGSKKLSQRYMEIYPRQSVYWTST